jgi:transcriptional regulator with XRE-family HTH domain
VPANILYDTQGRRALARYLERHTQAELAERLGVCQQTVSNLKNGKSRPESLIRALLQRVAAIPVDAWLLPDELRRIRAA